MSYKRQAFDYIFFIFWLLRDSIISFKKSLFLYVAFNLASTLSNVFALALAVKYIGSLSKPGPSVISKFGIHIEMNNSTPYLLGGLLLMSSLCLFFSSRLITRTMRLYEEKCVYSVLNIFLERSFFGRPKSKEHLTESDLVKSVTRDARVSGRALSTVWTSIVPTVMVIGSGAFILYLNMMLSLTLFAVAGCSIYFYILIGRKASGLSENIQTYARGDSRSRAVYIQYLNKIGSQIKTIQSDAAKLLKSEASSKFLDIYEERLRVVHYGLLAGNLVLAVIVFIVMSFFTYKVQHGEDLWSYTLFYFLGLNYCFGNLRTIGKSLTTLNIFFPFFSRYIAFATQLQISHHDAKGETYEDLEFEVISDEDPNLKVKWERGAYLDSFFDCEINKVNVNYIIESLLGAKASLLMNKIFKVQFATGTWPLLGESVEDNILIFKNSVEDVGKTYPFDRFFQLEESVLEASKKEDFSINIWNRRIDRGYKFIVSLLPILAEPADVVLLDGEALYSLPDEETKFILEKLKTSHIVVINPPPEKFEGKVVLQIKAGKVYFNNLSDEYLTQKKTEVEEPSSGLLDLDLDLDS